MHGPWFPSFYSQLAGNTCEHSIGRHPKAVYRVLCHLYTAKHKTPLLRVRSLRVGYACSSIILLSTVSLGNNFLLTGNPSAKRNILKNKKFLIAHGDHNKYTIVVLYCKKYRKYDRKYHESTIELKYAVFIAHIKKWQISRKFAIL